MVAILQKNVKTLAAAAAISLLGVTDDGKLGKAAAAFYFPVATEASIRAAAVKAIAVGGGYIMLPDARVTLTSPLPVASGIRYHGVMPRSVFTSNVPDAEYDFIGGTILAGNGTFACFEANAVPKGSPAAVFGADAIDKFGAKRMAFDGFTSAINIGATNQMGLMWGEFDELWAENCTDFAYQLVNHMHTHIGQIFVRNSQHGMRFAADVATLTLQPGNNSYDHLMVQTRKNSANNRLCRGVVFEAAAGASFGLNRMGKVQVNHHSRAKLSISAGFTSGSADITVPDGTQFPVGMLVVITADLGSSFIANRTYIVVSQIGNVIQLSNTSASAAIAADTTASRTMDCYGFACVEMIGRGGTGLVSNCTIADLDLEGMATVGLYAERAVLNTMTITGIPGPGSCASTYALRSSQGNAISCNDNTIHDIDGNSTQSKFYGNLSIARQRLGQGIWRDGTKGIDVLNLKSSGTGLGDLQVRGANGFIYPDTPIGSKIFPRDISITLSPANGGGLVVFNGAAGQTFTLPTITDAAEASSLVGSIYEVANVGANALSVATSGSQLMNGVAGKTTMSLGAGAHARFVAAKTAGGTLVWVVTVSAALP